MSYGAKMPELVYKLIIYTPFLLSQLLSCFIGAICISILDKKISTHVGIFFVVIGAFPFIIFSYHNNPLYEITIKLILAIISIYYISYCGAMLGNKLNHVLRG